MEKVSVIIPVYNRENTVERAIRSVLDQTYTYLDIIVVDDNSTDSSLEVIYRLASTEERIKVFKSEKNRGAAAARNLGITHADTNLIALLDSDDIMHPQLIELSLNRHEKMSNRPFFTRTGVAINSDDLKFTRKKPAACIPWKLNEKYHTSTRPYLYDLKFGTAAGIVFNREFFNVVGLFDDNLPAAEDTDLFIRASEITLGEAIPYVLILKDNSGVDRLTKNYQKLLQAYTLIYKKNKHLILQDKRLRKRFAEKMGRLAFFSGMKSEGIIYYLGGGLYTVLRPKNLLKIFAGIILPTSGYLKFYLKE